MGELCRNYQFLNFSYTENVWLKILPIYDLGRIDEL